MDIKDTPSAQQPGAASAQSKETSAKDSLYQCIQKCFVNGILYYEGDTFRTSEKVPEDLFKKIG